MSISPELLIKLICSECKNFLSATPVKVYHSKVVKCDRCSRENDGGVISKLYETVADYIKFPCINHRDGCRQLLSHCKVTDHEKNCTSKFYQCPLCYSLIKGTLLEHHALEKHSGYVLKVPVFKISLDKQDTEWLYLYSEGSIFAGIFLSYVFTTKTLHFKISTLGDTSRSLKYKFIFKPKPTGLKNKYYSCSNFNDIRDDTGLEKLKIKPTILYCQFEIVETSPLLILYRQEEAFIKQSGKAKGVTFTINIEELLNKSEKRIVYSSEIFIHSTSFKIIVRLYTKKDQEEIIVIGLVHKNLQNSIKEPIIKNISLALLSCNAAKKDYVQEKLLNNAFVVPWDDFVNPENGYIHNGYIKVQLALEVQFSDEDDSYKRKRCLCLKQPYSKKPKNDEVEAGPSSNSDEPFNFTD